MGRAQEDLENFPGTGVLTKLQGLQNGLGEVLGDRLIGKEPPRVLDGFTEAAGSGNGRGHEPQGSFPLETAAGPKIAPECPDCSVSHALYIEGDGQPLSRLEGYSPMEKIAREESESPRLWLDHRNRAQGKI